MPGLKYLPLVLKYLVRHRTRSLLTLGGVATAMFLFYAVQAMQVFKVGWDATTYDGRTDTPRDTAHRFWMRNNDINTQYDHFLDPSSFNYQNTWSMGKSCKGTGYWGIELNSYHPSNGLQQKWMIGGHTSGNPSCPMEPDVWYRIEMLFKWQSNNGFKWYCNVYNTSATLLWDSDDFESWDDDVWLGTWIQSNNLYFDDSAAGHQDPNFRYGYYGNCNCINIGNNGNAGASGEGEKFWAFSDYKVIDASDIEYDDDPWVGA